MDTIHIKDLVVNYRVGVPDQERAKPQRLWITVQFSVDFTEAAKSDNLAHTIDYFAVTQLLLGFGEGREWRLIETLAIEIAELLLQGYKPLLVSVQIKKFIIPEARYVAVTATRPLNA